MAVSVRNFPIMFDERVVVVVNAQTILVCTFRSGEFLPSLCNDVFDLYTNQINKGYVGVGVCV